tara:strand:+ start:52933 stop:53997 length:1065 start_codon:yes stop_codon:yes gene_type:complete
MFGIVVLGILAFFFVAVPEAMFIIFAGILVALILLGIVRLVKSKIPAKKNMLLISTIIFTIIATIGVGWLVSSRIAIELGTFSEQLPKAIDEFMAYLQGFKWFNKLQFEASQGNWMENFIAPKVLPQTAKMATVILNGLTAFGIALFLGIYFAVDSKRYGKLLLKLVPEENESQYQSLFKGLEANLQNWLLGKLFSMIGVFILTYIGLLVFGIKAALPLAFIAGFLSFIPNVGPILSVVPALFIAFAQGWETMIYVAGLYMLVQALEGFFLTPLIQKRKVRVLPAALISFQFIMAILYGFPGLFLATPLLVALMTTVDIFWINRSKKSRGNSLKKYPLNFRTRLSAPNLNGPRH